METRRTARFRVEAAAACLFLLGALPRPSGAQEWRAAIEAGLVKEPVLGLLNLPDVIGAECAASNGTARLRSSPSASSPEVALLRQREPCRLSVRLTGADADQDLPTSESGYETPAAVVFQREGSWFRIALQQGSAWIERANSTDFLPYPDLLTARLTCLGVGCDGRLWETPDASNAKPLPAARRPHLNRDVPIEFLGSMRVVDQT